MAGYLEAVKAELGATPLWANLTNDTDTTDDWEAYLPHLDGIMNEYFVARWDGIYARPAVWEQQLRQVELVLGQGKQYLIASQGGRDDVDRMRFALASYLLVAGAGATFRYADNTGGEATSPNYYQLWRYPEYDARLGPPTSARYHVGSAWRRDFACGYVTADPVSHIGTIVAITWLRLGCF
jgi:hypothetical protein